ncbi:sensor histidine kinase [Daejeonella lutea]|uniref:histidine kinase n=1 Tax=Daejeonella lutea TaxID=572036 RepID=A0A1T5AIT2_9SPHI|nr:HAMP domain-containing sensor histidine kinase [Daejeonella lutea]SKB34932.1 two-component system, OmpR family, sensor histidine kinase VicK [Daejeonella lutea]
MEKPKNSPAKYRNISFVYHSGRNEFLHIDDSLGGLKPSERENITPELALSLVHPDDRIYVKEKFIEFLQGSLSGGVDVRVELNGEIHRVRLIPFVIQEDGVDLIAGTVSDITAEWKNHESVLRYANKKNSILNMLAHDLRGPLEIANTLVKRIDTKLEDAAHLRDVRTISSILKESIQLIANLIDRELLETVEVELTMKRMDIVMKISEYIEECKRSGSIADRVFEMSSSTKSIYVDLDEAKFMQIMNNLLTNALKFTHPGGNISVGIEEKQESVVFSFSDNGIGIPDEFHHELFEKFTPARRKGLNGEPSTGLGLSIVKMIVGWHHGKVWFESREHEGTTIFIEIPKIYTPES